MSIKSRAMDKVGLNRLISHKEAAVSPAQLQQPPREW